MRGIFLPALPQYDNTKTRQASKTLQSQLKGNVIKKERDEKVLFVLCAPYLGKPNQFTQGPDDESRRRVAVLSFVEICFFNACFVIYFLK